MKPMYTIPKINVMTVRQAAEYYEVTLMELFRCLLQHECEIVPDGIAFLDLDEFESKGILQVLRKASSHTVFVDMNGAETILYPGANLVLSRRAMLRLGMLLTSSPVADDVRDHIMDYLTSSAMGVVAGCE